MADAAELLAALRHFGLEDDRLDAYVARKLEAGAAEFKAMDHIHAAGELTPGQLGDRLALTSGAVTGLIDRLERIGWVVRAPHATDRRSVVVRPASQSGEAPMLYADYARRVLAAAEELSDGERDACLTFLKGAAAAARATAEELRESRGSGPAPTGSPGRGSPPTPGA